MTKKLRKFRIPYIEEVKGYYEVLAENKDKAIEKLENWDTYDKVITETENTEWYGEDIWEVDDDE